MDQAFDALLDLHEAAVVGDVRDLAEQARVRRVTPRDVLPRIRAELLDAERDALALAVELEDAHVDLVADLDDLRRMLDALPRHVRDVQQAVDAAEVDERAVVGQVLDRTLDDVAFLQVVEQLRALGAVFLLDDRAARDDDVVAALVELDDLEFEFLAFEVARVAHRAHVHERAGQECADVVEFDREAALDAAVDDALDDLALGEGFLEAGPGACALGFLAREARLAGAVLDGIQRNLDFLADLDVDHAVLIAELIRGYDGFGLEADADDDDIGIHVDDGAGQDLTWLELLVRKTLFEKLLERFGHWVFRATGPIVVTFRTASRHSGS